MAQRMQPKLKREINLWQATFIGIGLILGAGIYVLIGKAASIAGNGVWLSFALSSLIAIFTGLSYAELSSIFPKAGAEYVYTKHAFGNKIAFVIGWLIVISGFVFSATVAFGFAGYFERLFGAPYQLTAFILILLLSFLVFYGIKESVWFGVIATLIEMCGLFIVIFLGIPYLGKIDYFEIPDVSNVFTAAALVFFAYIGFEQISRLSEETKNPKVNIHRATILSIVITTIIYILVSISAVSIVDWRILGSSNAPLAEISSKTLGTNGFLLLSVIALFATANTVLFMMVSTSRMIYGIGKSFSSNNIFARVHSKTRTPWVATIVTTVFSALSLSFGKIETVANITNFLIFFVFIFINISVIKLRFSIKKEEHHFRIPLNIGKIPIIPILGIISCIMLMAYVNLEVIIYSCVLIFFGFLIIEILERKGIKAKFE
ncbi:MAG: amino acid permease [Candidatus Aenigmatarchaeota archaeon]